MAAADIDFSSIFEYGLRLPNGAEIWPPQTFHGRALSTPQDRAIIVHAINEAHRNLGYVAGADSTTSRYRWLVREIQTITVVRPLESEELAWEDPAVVEVPEEVSEGVLVEDEWRRLDGTTATEQDRVDDADEMSGT